MKAKPKHLGMAYAAQFRDSSVAAAYHTRPPYPPEVFTLLTALIRDEPRVVLDLGCGTGDIGRVLVDQVERVDAVDPSAAMLARGRGLAGGDHPRLRWVQQSAEEFDYPETYALIVAAESLHWMQWDIVLPRIRRAGEQADARDRDHRPLRCPMGAARTCTAPVRDLLAASGPCRRAS